MIDVNDFKVGDKVVLRDGTTATVEKISKYEKGFGLHLSCFPGKELGCYSSGWQKNFYESKYDIVEHIPNQGEEYEPSAEWMAKWGRKDEEPAQDEMTMRDQFAMSALNGLVIGTNNWRGTSPEELSEVSYALADAMMKARKGE